MSINRCDICYHYVKASCADTISFQTGLDPNETYTIVIEDQNGNNYVKQDIEMGGNGYTINVADYPEGMFNQWSGSYEIYFTDGGFDGEQQTLTIDGKEYPCILMTFKNTIDIS